nr:hypothetical protein [uncultured Acidovorax sp.]
MHKLSYAVADGWAPHSHAAAYSVVRLEHGERVLAGIPNGESAAFVGLVSNLEPPYFLLYVLHTPRGEGEPGRYQNPALSQEEFLGFVRRFSSYLSSDARFDLWAHSAASQGTVVWDRHNQLFAYGPLAKYCSLLDELGFVHGDAAISFPHQHHYRKEFDDDAKELLGNWPWTYSPLRPEDEQ